MMGNLLPSRLAGANIRLAGKEGDQQALLDALEKELQEKGMKPYVFPSGGSNSMGSWGYFEMVHELQWQMQQANLSEFDALYFSCGSGGTGAGLALGLHLC